MLSGTQREGYVRLEGEREAVIQVRWKASKPVTGINRRVLAYFSQIERTAKRSRQAFRSNIDILESGAVDYEWHAGAKGYGRMWFEPEARRVMFVERSGRSGDSFKREARELVDSVECHTGSPIPWSILGVSVWLPANLQLSSFKLLSGRTTLVFKRRLEKFTVDRWAFASQLLAKHDFCGWAVAATGIKADCEVGKDGIRLNKGRRTALVMHDQERNQLLVINAVHSRAHAPQWDFFD